MHVEAKFSLWYERIPNRSLGRPFLTDDSHFHRSCSTKLPLRTSNARTVAGSVRSIPGDRGEMERTLANAEVPACPPAEGEEPRMPDGFKTEFDKDGWRH
jgi:hypothetical protein